MNKNCIESKDRQNQLYAEMTMVKEEFQTLLQNNIKADKKLREEKCVTDHFETINRSYLNSYVTIDRTKVIQKLQGWIAKYDNDVGERNQLLFQLNGDLELANQTLFRWQQNFDTQDVM